MKLHLYPLLYFIFLSLNLNAQYGHEWIDVGKSYIRIKTYQNGIYYLTQNALHNAGMPLNTDPRTIRMYHRGREQRILISGENDGSFDMQDTLFFYGQRNNGFLDSALYQSPALQPNKLLNLHSDTTAYFLNWGGTFSSKRMSMLNVAATSQPLYHHEQVSACFHDSYSRGQEFGAATSSKYFRGEGWTSNYFNAAWSAATFEIKNPLPSAFAPMLEVQLVGRTRHPDTRIVAIKAGDPAAPFFQDTITFTDYNVRTKTFALPLSVLSENSLTITIEPLQNNASSFANIVSLNYLKLTYPQELILPYSLQKVFHFSGSAAPQSLSVGWSSPLPRVFDISDPDNVNLLSTTYNGTLLQFNIPENADSVLAVSKSELLTPHEIAPKLFSIPDMDAEYLIISHKSLQTETEEYAEYRSSQEGGGYEVEVQWIDDLCDLFSYGEFTPLSIFNYSKYQIAQNEQAQFLFLIGKGLEVDYFSNKYYRWEPSNFYSNPNEGERLTNLVPPFGTPGSDLLYSMNNANFPQLAVGRICSKTPLMLSQYLEKIKEFDANNTNMPWRKNLVHISGGNGKGEIKTFLSYMNALKTVVENSPWEGEVIRTISKDTNSTGIMVTSLANELNTGSALVNFYGHASYTKTDPDFGYASVDSNNIRNKGKYPILILNGCTSANPFYQYSLAEDWVNTPERGAILCFGSTDIQYTYPMYLYSTHLYKHMFEKPENYNKPFAQIIVQLLNDPTFPIDELTRMQMNLYGDPAVSVNYFDTDSPVALSDQLTDSSWISIQPNPNNGSFALHSTFASSIEIMGANGAVLFSDQLQHNFREIQLQLPSGLYLVRLTGDNRTAYKKLIIE